MAEKDTKKRKRQSNGVDTSNKKAHLSSDSSIKLTHRNDGPYPVLASSPGLTPPAITFNAYAKLLSGKDDSTDGPTPSTHNLLLHSSKHPRLDYTAAPSTLDQHLSHYVGVFDPATKQLQVTPAYHLDLRCALRSGAEDEKDKQRRTYAQQREELGREFGTKKAKKAISDRTVNAIVKDTKGKAKKDEVQDAILDSMAQSTPAALKAGDEAKAALAAKPIPTPNLDAEAVEDVYPFDTLIPRGDARIIPIKDWQEKIQADENIVLNSRFVAYRIQAIGKTDNILRLKALRYLSLLHDFHNVLQNAGRAGKKVPKKETMARKLSSWPEALVDSVRRRFSNPSNELPKWYMDNLYTHMCALTLYIDGWSTNTANLRDDLGMENKAITQYFRELGCRVTAPTEKETKEWKLDKKVVSSTKVARLRLPLDFPKARTARRT